MAGRDPGEATQSFLDSLQRAISCVCPDVLIASGYGPRPEPNAVAFDRGRAAQLQGNDHLLLRVRLEFVYLQVADIRGPWKINTVGYWYSLETRDEVELLLYHWHPNATPDLTFPHLHLKPAARVGYIPLTEAHIPTGHIALEDVLRLAITSLGVKPLRPDWETVLYESQAVREVSMRW